MANVIERMRHLSDSINMTTFQKKKENIWSCVSHMEVNFMRHITESLLSLMACASCPDNSNFRNVNYR